MFPLIFKPKNNFKMIRIGSKYDGGYLAEIESIKNSNILISMGINNNWEFEKSFSKFNNDISIFSYDNMTDNRFLIKTDEKTAKIKISTDFWLNEMYDNKSKTVREANLNKIADLSCLMTDIK